MEMDGCDIPESPLSASGSQIHQAVKLLGSSDLSSGYYYYLAVDCRYDGG